MLEQFAWPGVAVILGFVFLLLFRGPISRLIDRISKVGPTGISAIPATQESGKSPQAAQSDQLLKEFSNAVILKYEENVKADLNKRQLASPSDREKLLIRHYTTIMLCLSFERIYGSIYGSQIAAIEFLNTCGNNGSGETEFFNFYMKAKATYPQLYKGYSFQQWSDYLLSSTLITRSGDRVLITPEGREFLKYLLDQGHSLSKPF